MSEIGTECNGCEDYQILLEKYRKLKKKVRKMRKSFAAIECAVLHKCSNRNEFIVGECEAHRGRYEMGC